MGDLDGDGNLDVVVGNVNQPNRLYQNNGTENPFANVTGINISDDADDTTSIALGDMDGDGNLDVVTADNFGANRLYLNNGTENPFANVTGVNISDDDDETETISVGDVDGDGDLDVVVGNFERVNRLYLNNGTENPFVGVTGIIINDAEETLSIALRDFNGDGDFDVAFGKFCCEDNRIYLNNGTDSPFKFVNPLFLSETGVETTSLTLGDLNGDGYLDVVVRNYRSDNTLQLNNGSDNPFANVTQIPLSSFGSTVLGDVNADGHLDIIAAEDGATHLYLNNGTDNPFAEVDGLAITTSGGTRALGDVDGDGNLDLVLGRFGVPNHFYPITMETGPTPKAPSNLSVTALSASSIDLGWKDNSNDETGFRIDRKSGEESFSEIASVNANTTNFTDSDLQAETMYTYRVRAENVAGVSGYSNVITATTLSGLPAFPITLQGNSLPEKATVELTVNKSIKPVATARLILEVFDADKSNEGELIINGNSPIRLFGNLKSPENNRTTARIVINTFADWWQNGANTLEFIHTQSGGYRVESGFVEFGATEISDFPIVMQGRELPEETEVILTVSKPENPRSEGFLDLTIFDADKRDEGFLTINGNEAIPFFGNRRRPENDRTTIIFSLRTPSEWWKDGDNILGFAHTKSGGYRVESASVKFQ